MRSLCALLLVLASLVAGGFAASACTVTDFSTGDKYDLSPLTRTSGQNWALDTLQYTYLLNICADLLPQPIVVNGVTKNCNSTQACQIDKQNVDQSPKRLGSNPKLVVKDTGNIQLKLSGGDHCKKADVDRSVSILFNCNRKAGPGTPKFVEEDEGCLYIFEWDTVYACPSTKPTPSIETPKDCLVTDAKGQALYDLSPLTRSSGNWIVAEGNYSYLLNICAAVHGVEDCAGHSACQTKPKDPNFAKPLGLSTGRPTVENGVLKLVLTGGSLCHEQYSRKTTIIFTCKEGPSLGEPKFLEETDECMYIFSWETSAACSEDVVHTCNATDPVTSKYVDLSPLRKADSAKSNYVAASAVPGDKATYKLNLCGELASSDNPCRVGTSICQVAEGQVIGRSLGSSGVLSVDSGDVIMTYTDGDLCPGTDERASSEIYFICSETESNPRLISSSNDCQYLFNWRTRYACEGAPPTQKSGLSGGAIAIIVILSLIAAYMLGGIAYNRFVRGEKGVEQIPHYGLCQAVYYTIADRCSGLRSGTGGIQLA